MDTPELPKGYFFRVIQGRVEDWGLSEYNARVELRKKVFFWSVEEGYLTVPNSHDTHPTQRELFDIMTELKSWWENKKNTILPYGDYPPKTLKELDANKTT